MSPKAGQMLLDKVRPVIRAVIGRGKVKAVGCEDAGELEADAVAQAAAIIESAERDGREVFPSSVAYYALRNLQRGRRFGCSAGDAMSSAVRISARVKGVDSLDAPLGSHDDDPDGEFTLLDALASPGEDAAAAAGREIDWAAAEDALDGRERDVLGATAMGLMGTAIAQSCGVSAPRITQIKRSIGGKLRRALGDDALAACVREPVWRAGMRAGRERRACRYAGAA